jgi:hypothetical protein
VRVSSANQVVVETGREDDVSTSPISDHTPPPEISSPMTRPPTDNKFSKSKDMTCVEPLAVGNPIDSGMGLSITIDKLLVFINKTLSTQSLIGGCQ